jgi:2-keto-4-pentenoate hydratase/2-oxohepta-3-ene-1,7-dioic acid hydratase in catechol pathway
VKVSETLSRCSAMGYNSGDVISTGEFSPSVAPDHETKAKYLKPGDVIECEIEHIGVLRNQIISWEEAYGRKPTMAAKQGTE